LDGNPRSEADFASIRPQGKRISDENHNPPAGIDLIQDLDNIVKSVLPSPRSQFIPQVPASLELTPEAIKAIQRKHDMMHRVMLGERLTMSELIEYALPTRPSENKSKGVLDVSHIGREIEQAVQFESIESDGSRVSMVNDPNGNFVYADHRGLRRMSKVASKPKEVGCAPPYFITAARPQARPKVTAFMVKLALYMKYVTDKEKN
jgi:hypothetical protein